MNQIRKYVPLMQVVAMAADEDRTTDLDRYWVFGFRALVDIYGMITAEPKTVKLPVTDGNTVLFPSDYIVWTKAGIMGNDGKIVPLAYNRTISKYKDEHPERLTKIAADINDGDQTFYNYLQNGEYLQLPCNSAQLLQPGEFNVDEKNELIVLPPTFGYDSIILEYISEPEKDKGYQVEQATQEAVIAFIKWKAKTGPSVEYYDALSNARRKMNPMHLQVLNQVIRENNGYKVKA